MSQTRSASCGRPYGLARTCRVLELARSTVHARRVRRLHPVPLRKRGPKSAWSDAELVELIRQVLASSPFVGEGYRKVWARLRLGGIRTSLGLSQFDGQAALGQLRGGSQRPVLLLDALRAAAGEGRVQP